MSFKKHIAIAVSSCAALCAALVLARPVQATDFIRGDANGDGVVSIADVQRILAYKFHGAPPPSCLNAADADDSGEVNSDDAAQMARFIAGFDLPPSWPYPSAGADVRVPNSFAPDCAAYGGGAALDDPQAELEVLDAIAPGGGTPWVTVTIAVSSSAPIAGFSGRIKVGGQTFQSHEIPQSFDPWGPYDYYKDLTGTSAMIGLNIANVTLVNFKDGAVRFSLISSPTSVPGEEKWIAAGTHVSAMQVRFCLKTGTPAGDYPLELEAGELIDAASARAIHPLLTSGTLTVARAVTQGCGTNPPPPSKSLNAVYRIGSATAPPGSSVVVPFTIAADKDVQGYSFSVDFDEEVLQATRIETAWARPDGALYDFAIFELNNSNTTPGNQGVDEGYLIGAAVFDFPDSDPGTIESTLPANSPEEVVRFHFVVDANTSAHVTELTFLDGGGKSTGHPVHNVLTAEGVTYTAQTANSFIFVNGVIGVIDDIATFIRGDSNGDGKVDISDSQTTLSYLFLGDQRPYCFDAADFNDDGLLDLSDPIGGLNYLFLGKSAPPPPFGQPGEDPTEDTMTCLVGPVP